MKNLLVLGLLTLSTFTFAETTKGTCKGTLLAVETKAFGGEKYTIDANWKIVSDGTTITVSEGHVKMTGTVEGAVAKVTSEEFSERMTLTELDEKHIEVKGQTLNKSGKVVANVSGVLTCK